MIEASQISKWSSIVWITFIKSRVIIKQCPCLSIVHLQRSLIHFIFVFDKQHPLFIDAEFGLGDWKFKAVLVDEFRERLAFLVAGEVVVEPVGQSVAQLRR